MRRRRACEAYQEDLAYVHDAGFGGFAHGAGPGVMKILRRAGVRSGDRVVDLGCGSGIWARRLTDAGCEVLGIDISPAMIFLARRRAPRATFRVGSLLRAPLPPCAAVTSLGECLNYLFDRRNNLASLRRLFIRVHAALRDGGLFIFDVLEPGADIGPRRTYAAGPDWAVLVERKADLPRQRLSRRITTFRRTGAGLYRRSEETHNLQLYRGVELARALRDAGFAVRLTHSYGRFPLRVPCVALIARKVGGPRRALDHDARPRHDEK